MDTFWSCQNFCTKCNSATFARKFNSLFLSSRLWIDLKKYSFEQALIPFSHFIYLFQFADHVSNLKLQELQIQEAIRVIASQFFFEFVGHATKTLQKLATFSHPPRWIVITLCQAKHSNLFKDNCAFLTQCLWSTYSVGCTNVVVTGVYSVKLIFNLTHVLFIHDPNKVLRNCIA